MKLAFAIVGVICVAVLTGGCQTADPSWWPGGRNYGQGPHGPTPEPPILEYSYPAEMMSDSLPATTIVTPNSLQ